MKNKLFLLQDSSFLFDFFLVGGKVVALLDADGGAGWEFLELVLSAPAAASSATRFDSGSLTSALSLLSQLPKRGREEGLCPHTQKSGTPKRDNFPREERIKKSQALLHVHLALQFITCSSSPAINRRTLGP